ncbi:MAG: hypothetical protein Q7T50_00360 [Candidatus Magasanikbacteria bacterium]|nr:hypothetical protein [Candidatus Magasanikbacteria bacterium]
MQNEVNPQADLGQVQGGNNLENGGTAEATEIEPEKKVEDKVIIHTMPKRFFRSAGGGDKSKNVGVLIIAFGIIFLVGIAVFAYFFFIKPSSEEAKILNETPTSTDVKKETPKENNTIPVEKPEEVEVIDNNLNNTSSSTEEIIPETEATTTPEVEVIPIIEVKASPDSDGDGLTDIEEAMINTIVNLRDSDSDSFDDLSEFLSLYNPAGTGSVITNPSVEKYVNIKNGYSLYYIKKMTVENVGGSEDSVMFKFYDGQMIQVVVAENPEKLSLEEWYKKQFGVSMVSSDQRVYKKGWTGIKSDDGLVVYLVSPASDKVYSLSYNISVDNILSRKNILGLMVNSFELK